MILGKEKCKVSQLPQTNPMHEHRLEGITRVKSSFAEKDL